MLERQQDLPLDEIVKTKGYAYLHPLGSDPVNGPSPHSFMQALLLSGETEKAYQDFHDNNREKTWELEELKTLVSILGLKILHEHSPAFYDRYTSQGSPDLQDLPPDFVRECEQLEPRVLVDQLGKMLDIDPTNLRENIAQGLSCYLSSYIHSRQRIIDTYSTTPGDATHILYAWTKDPRYLFPHGWGVQAVIEPHPTAGMAPNLEKPTRDAVRQASWLASSYGTFTTGISLYGRNDEEGYYLSLAFKSGHHPTLGDDVNTKQYTLAIPTIVAQVCSGDIRAIDQDPTIMGEISGKVFGLGSTDKLREPWSAWHHKPVDMEYPHGTIDEQPFQPDERVTIAEFARAFQKLGVI